MRPVRAICVVVVLGSTVACTGSSPAPQAPAPSGAQSEFPTGGIRNQPYSPADVHFMTGMIAHHSQAVLMAGWAPSHGASDSLQLLCERILVSQQDEIALMQDWLRERGLPVPEADMAARHHAMPGMEHDELMPGMLTAEQLGELDAARGREFDRLFLTYMIMHHQGALTMVDNLFNSYGAAQDDVVFKFANDVFADQEIEIERMQIMLDALSDGG
jgi:uncharacterized protein (DUF305 family)